jgi:hypothetical protein
VDCNDIDAIDQLLMRLRGQLTLPTDAAETGLRLASHATGEASVGEIEQVKLIISTELRHFWRQCREAEFFRDVDYDQWGLDIVSPVEAIRITCKVRNERSADFYSTDLVIGRFRGDSDLVLVRCDPEASDCGEVVVALPLDHRVDWYFTGLCLADFLRKFIDSQGRKFWEVHI